MATRQVVHGIEVVSVPLNKVHRLLSPSAASGYPCRGLCPFHGDQKCMTAPCGGDDYDDVIFMTPATYVTLKLTGEKSA